MVMLKVLPKRLVTVLVRTGLCRLLFSCFKFTSVTLQETLDRLTGNKDLQTVLSYICGDYGVFGVVVGSGGGGGGGVVNNNNDVHFFVPFLYTR